jgi:hypothetical protein
MAITILLAVVVSVNQPQSRADLSYPKDPRQHIAAVSQSGKQSPVTKRTGYYPKDITATVAQPAVGSPVASRKFKPKGGYLKDPRNNLAWP